MTKIALFIVTCSLLLLGTSSASADGLLVEACKRVAAHWDMKEEVAVKRVDDLSNLKPPRVRMRLDDFLSSVVSCTFSSTTKPVGLREYCPGGLVPLCFEAGDPQFDEVAELMRRNGY